MPDNITSTKPTLPQPKLPGAVVKKPDGFGQTQQVFPAPVSAFTSTPVSPSPPASTPQSKPPQINLRAPTPPVKEAVQPKVSKIATTLPSKPGLSGVGDARVRGIGMQAAVNQVGATNQVGAQAGAINQAKINSHLPPSPLSPPLSPPPPSPPPMGFKQQPTINPPKGGPGAPNQVIATVKKSPLLKFLPLIVGGLAVVGLVVFVITNLLGGSSPPVSSESSTAGGSSTGDSSSSQNTSQSKPSEQVELLYWGLFEDPTVMQTVIADFEEENPGVTIRYVKQSHVDYRERLQVEIAAGTGPDIFRFHASWVPMLLNELTVMPTSVMSLAEYQETFYPIASKMLQYNGQIVGIPLMYDGLALFYNKKMLQTAGASVPSTWRDLQTLAKELTVSGGTEETIQRGGLAVGNAQNVEHFADILGLLILQNGGDPAQPNTQQVKDALEYYTNFVKSSPVYGKNLPNSTTAFAREEVAMMLAPSWRVFEVLAMNPDLDFGLAPAPKLADQEIAWASFWAEGVSDASENQATAWAFLKYLSSAPVMQKLHSSQKQLRAFGEIYSRVDLADKLSSDSYASAYLEDAPNAQGWYLNSYTHDNGLNDMMIEYYADAINALLAGENIKDVVATLELAVSQSLAQYGLD